MTRFDMSSAGNPSYVHTTATTGNADVREDVGRRLDRSRYAEDDDQHRHDDERVRFVQRYANDAEHWFTSESPETSANCTQKTVAADLVRCHGSRACYPSAPLYYIKINFLVLSRAPAKDRLTPLPAPAFRRRWRRRQALNSKRAPGLLSSTVSLNPCRRAIVSAMLRPSPCPGDGRSARRDRNGQISLCARAAGRRRPCR